MIYFVTGNRNKFEEAREILPDLEQLDIDLPEIQETDAKEIIRKKLEEALAHQKGEFIVEDTSLYFECLGNLPGPLIKWFLKEMGNAGLANLAQKMGNNRARAVAILGYAKSPEEIYFFEGSVPGQIVPPRGETNFGWDPIFLPEGGEITFAEMDREEKNKISMRRAALEKLKEFLQKQ